MTEVGNDREQSFMMVEVDDNELHFQAITRRGKTIDSGTLKQQEKPKPAPVETTGAKPSIAASAPLRPQLPLRPRQIYRPENRTPRHPAPSAGAPIVVGFGLDVELLVQQFCTPKKTSTPLARARARR